MKHKALPGIFSVQRGMIISDAKMFSLVAKGGAEQVGYPIQVIRHGILGTQNVAGKDKDIKNPQRTESAKTDPDASGMAVRFSLSTITLDNAVFACDKNEFRESVNGFVTRFKGSGELREVCNRYARNILNGRWLWRNRILGKKIAVHVTSSQQPGEVIRADATRRPHEKFGDYSEVEKRLGDFLMKSLAVEPAQFTVEAQLDFGMTGAFEVFPSQNYVSDKPKGFARSLYKLDRIERGELLRMMAKDDPDAYMGDMVHMGSAAIRDQKIGNAIRTIDTWYEGNIEATPIPVEPKGANIETNEVKRKNNDLFDMILEIDSINPAQAGEALNREAMFILGNLVRGFLAGEKSEEKTSAKEGKGKKGKDNVPENAEAS
ncbi:MAG: type I-F CRISPR-associated protein Csy3 [Betaproteobacteria bacterium]|nr:type I-F CRISPR-associated protein Csy3 [Betaproteobacteria bacterium]